MPKPRNGPPKSPEELEQSLADDLLFGPLELAIAELQRRGMDPDAIRARGEEITRQLEKRHRLAWREPARQRLQRGRIVEPDEEDLPSDHASLVLLIEEAQADPRFAQQLSMKFAGRRPEEADAEELAGLLREIRLLAKLLQDDS